MKFSMKPRASMTGGRPYDCGTTAKSPKASSNPQRAAFRQVVSRPQRGNTLLPFFAVMDAHHAAEQVHHANMSALQLPHSCRDAFLRRVVLQGFRNVSVGRRVAAKDFAEQRNEPFQVAEIDR